MAELQQVAVDTLPTERFQEVLTPERYELFLQAAERARAILAGRVVWNVNSTARGGGVAEMLQSLLAYARGAGVDARWAVIQGNPDFFRITKRIHNHLHGAAGDAGELAEPERRIYEAVAHSNTAALLEVVRPDDIVIIHDPQPGGLVPELKRTGATIIWRCHVGLDFPNELARSAWNFLIPYVSEAHAYVFSRKAFAWEGLDPARITIIPPSIDAFAPKNQDLETGAVEAILCTTGLLQGDCDHPARFVRWDGREQIVDRPTELYDGGPPPPKDARLVVQVSRWDRLKDPVGVIEGFARHIAASTDAHLVAAGPSVAAVADDPEGKEVLEEALEAWRGLPDDVRPRVHLACLPMDDTDENAAIVNALQRYATVVVQKSIAEGFGLTVAEAMWKARPVVASRIGGIQDQMIDRETGLLIDDPTDLGKFGEAVLELLNDEAFAERLGRAAQERVRDEFLGARHLMQYVELIGGLIR
ncbi:MAG: glycosyltransferase [Actinomycetota bacterium]